MASIRGLNRLTALYLNCQSARSDVSNIGLAELAHMLSLRRLELRTNCSITALGTSHITPTTEKVICSACTYLLSYARVHVCVPDQVRTIR